MSTITPLDLAWEAINLLGCPDTAVMCDADRIVNDVVGRALIEIEKLGGSDPIARRYAEAKADWWQPENNVVQIGDHDKEYSRVVDVTRREMGARR